MKDKNDTQYCLSSQLHRHRTHRDQGFIGADDLAREEIGEFRRALLQLIIAGCQQSSKVCFGLAVAILVITAILRFY